MADTPREQYVAPAHFCAACRARGKTWNGSDPRCAVWHGKPFDPSNWNCATANAIRDLAGDDWSTPPPGILREQRDDQTYITIYTHDVDFPGGTYPWCLWVTWYKSRGRVGNMVLLAAEEEPTPRAPTEADLLAILEHYKNPPHG